MDGMYLQWFFQYLYPFAFQVMCVESADLNVQ